MAKKKNKSVQAIDPATLDTYFKKRMYAIGITDTADHSFKVEGEHPSPAYNQPIFAEDDKGNIVINYPCLYGGYEPIGQTENAFTRIRFKPENQPGPDVKYYQEKGTGVHLFIPPAIIQKYSAKTPIETLFVVEGEFKAYAGALQGLDIIGIGGKDLFKDDDKKQLHGDILAIIRHCDVENLVLLLDADVKQVTWDPETEPMKDLGKRLRSFAASVLTFRELGKGLVRDVYFSYLRPGEHNAKGLDDLLQVLREGKDPSEADKCCTDLKKLTRARQYFECLNLSKENPYKIKGEFFLNPTKGVPAAFYYEYDSLIGDREFNFGGAMYQKKGDAHELQMVKHEDSFKFMRVGCDYVKIINVPDAKGILRRRLKGWKAGELTRDYINMGFKNFFDTLEKYDEYCNVPCHNEAYRPVIENCYNMYYQLSHEQEPGDWPVTEAFLKHIFGQKKLKSDRTNYDLGLDYLTILYRIPTQRLPILCLVNEERNTGKSTFLWFIKELFQDNTTFIGSEDLKDQFNDDWASKLLIGIDEGFIDKKHVLEKLKSMSTAPSIKLRMMHQGRQEIPFFGKFVLTSNDEYNFVGVDENETRFWVNKVPVLTSDDPDVVDKMSAEIPAFLHYLATREISHPKKTRHWFSPDLLDTEAGRKVKENSKGWLYSELKEIMKDKFIHYRYPTLYYTLGDIAKMLNGADAGTKFRKSDIAKQLREKFKLESKLRRFEFPKEPQDQNELGKVLKHDPDRVYEFRIENFFTEPEIREELSEFFDYNQIITGRGSKTVAADDDEPF